MQERDIAAVSIAWGLADRYPARLASLTVLSRPHPNAFNRALAAPDGEQKRRSSHHWWFLEANAAEQILADNVRWLRERLKRQRQLSPMPAFINRQRRLSRDQYEIVDVHTSRGVRRAMLFPKAILQAEFEANAPLLEALAIKRERLRASEP